ncbi:MAG: hypothetical protein AAF791_11570 [Bacteroidota bacterium]
MLRFAPLALLVFSLTACSDPGVGLSADAAYRAADEAADAGEARRALALYESAADRGHLDAMEALANAHRDGYVRSTTGGPFTALFPLPWEGDHAARHWQDRLDRAETEGIRTEDAAVMYRVANRLRRSDVPAERDSADALVATLLERDDPHTQLMHALRIRMDAPTKSDSLLARAEAGGSYAACTLRLTYSWVDSGAPPPDASAARAARHIDQAEACPPVPASAPDDYQTVAERLVSSLRETATEGDTRAVAQLDSLRLLGVFERHPHLDA